MRETLIRENIFENGLASLYTAVYPYLPPAVQRFFDNWQSKVFLLKIISVVLSLVFLAIIIWLAIKVRENIINAREKLSQGSDLLEKMKEEVSTKWQSVLKKIEGADENSWKMAVVEADSVFDDLLKKMGYEGEDMGERLKQISPAEIPNLSEIWQAHKIRNRIVHEPDFRLTKFQAEQMVGVYYRLLKDLDMVV
jgi:hypothetical protein